MKQAMGWLVVGLVLLAAAYALGVFKSYCERASEDYCRRPGTMSNEALEECIAEAINDCQVRSGRP